MIICLTFIIIGAVLLSFVPAGFKKRIMFVKNGKRVEGTVIKLVEIKDKDNDIYYHPVFEIKISDKETMTYEGIPGSNPSFWSVRQKEAFIYTPDKYPGIRRLGYWSVFWEPLLFLIVGIDFLVIGAGYFLLHGYFTG